MDGSSLTLGEVCAIHGSERHENHVDVRFRARIAEPVTGGF